MGRDLARRSIQQPLEQSENHLQSKTVLHPTRNGGIMFSQYTRRSGIKQLITTDDFTGIDLAHIFKQSPHALTVSQVTHLYQYDVPATTPDGACSVLDQKADLPYDLRPILDVDSPFDQLTTHSITTWLWQLNQLIRQLASKTELDWLGIYAKKLNKDKQPVLVKLAYHGRISRAEFPLTPEFAKKSNNSTVGLTGKAVCFQDLATYDGPYYECDDQVKSECCLPIFDQQGKTIGIIDAESSHRNFFTPTVISELSYVCAGLGNRLTPR